MKNYYKVFSIILTIVVLFLFWTTVAYEHSNNTISASPLKEFPQMQIVDGDRGSLYSAHIVLPKDFNRTYSLYFKTSHERMNIYLDKEKIYSFGYDKNPVPFLKSPGTSWHVVSLPALSAGKELVINFSTPYKNFEGFVPYIQYGTQGECIAEFQNSSIYSLLSILIILIGGFTAVILYFFTRFKKYAMSKSFLYISSFAFFVSIWILFQSGSAQLFFGYPQVMYFIDLISLILFPIPINIYIYHICLSNKKKGVALFSWAYIVLLVINLLLQVTGLVDMYQLAIFTHSLMALNMLYVAYLVYVEVRIEKNRNMRSFMVPLGIIIAGGIVEMVMYYYSNMTRTSVALRFSVLIFLLILVADSVRRYYKSLMELNEAEYYERLARTDLLTNLANRNRYEEVLSAYKPGDPLAAVLFDLNSLKYINDNYGHSTGDTALKNSAICIREAFSKRGECFRIGGDEFAVLSKSKECMQAECKAFESLVKHWAGKSEFPFSIAYGVACFDSQIDKTAYDTTRRADFSMYNMKQKQKHDIMKLS